MNEKKQTGTFTIQDLEKSGFFISGKYVSITKNNIPVQYLVIGSGDQTRLVDVSNHSYVQGPQLQALLADPAKVTVAELTSAEQAQLKTFSPEYKTQKEFEKVLKNNPEVKGVRYFEADVIGTSRKSTSPEPEVPAIVYTELRQKIRNRAMYEHSLDTTHEALENKKRIATINRKDAQELYKNLQEAGINTNNLNDFDKINAVVKDSAHKEIKGLFQSAAKGSGGNWFNLLGKANDSEMNIEIKNKDFAGTDFSSIHVVDDIQKTNDALFQEFQNEKRNSTQKGIYTSKKININTNEATKNLVENLSKQQFNIHSVEARSESIKRMGLETQFGSIQGDVEEHVRQFERVQGSSLSKHPAAQVIDIMKKASTYDGTKMLAGVSSEYGIGPDKKLNEFTKTVEKLRSYEAGEAVGKDGTIRAVNPKEIYAGKVNMALKDTLFKASAATENVGDLELRKKINNYVGELHYSDSFAKQGSYQKLPKQVTQKTGLLRTVSSLVGTYFYQSMLHNTYRKGEEFFKNALEPSEIIEAKKHSSMETTARRLVTTDFGSKLSEYSIVLKDLLIKGRTSTQVFQKFKNNDTVRALVNSVKQKEIRQDNIEKLGRLSKQYYDDSKAFVENLPNATSRNVQESLNFIRQHPKATIVSTSSALLITNYGDSQVQTEDDKMLSKRYRNASQKEYVDKNKVYSSDYFHSENYIQKTMTAGFGSKFDGLRSLLRITRGTTREGEIVRGISIVSEKELVKKIPGGLTFNKLDNRKLESSLAYSKSMGVRNSALPLREDTKNRIFQEIQETNTIGASVDLFKIKDRENLQSLNKFTWEDMQATALAKPKLERPFNTFSIRKNKLPQTYATSSYKTGNNLPNSERSVDFKTKRKTELVINQEQKSFYEPKSIDPVIQDNVLEKAHTSQLKTYGRKSIEVPSNRNFELQNAIVNSRVERKLSPINLDTGNQLDRTVRPQMESNAMSKSNNINKVAMNTNKINRGKKFGDKNQGVLSY